MRGWAQNTCSGAAGDGELRLNAQERGATEGAWGLFRVISEATGRELGPTEGETVAIKSHFETLGPPKEEEETTGLTPWLGCHSSSLLSRDQERPALDLSRTGDRTPAWSLSADMMGPMNVL